MMWSEKFDPSFGDRMLIGRPKNGWTRMTWKFCLCGSVTLARTAAIFKERLISSTSCTQCHWKRISRACMYSWDVTEATQQPAQVGKIYTTAAANFMECVAMKRMMVKVLSAIRCIPDAWEGFAFGLAMRTGSKRMRDRKIIKTFIRRKHGQLTHPKSHL